MTKTEEFEKLRKQSQTEKDKIAGVIADLIRKESELAEAANAAAEAGDVDLYQQKTSELGKVRATIYVRRKQMEKLCPFTDADVVAAWGEYASSFNKGFQKRLDEYGKAREALRKMYMELVRDQNAALVERDRYAGFIQDAGALNKVELVLLDNSNCKIFHPVVRCETADQRFIRSWCKTAEEDEDLLSLFNAVVNLRTPHIK